MSTSKIDIAKLSQHLRASAVFTRIEAADAIDHLVAENVRLERERDHAQDVLNALKADAEPKACTWSQYDIFDMPGTYDTGCKNSWSFTEGDLSDNKIKYCPYCSGHIVDSMKRG